MRYEAVVLSGEEEETDYSSGEEEALLQSANAPPTSEPVVGHQHGLACAESSESSIGFLYLDFFIWISSTQYIQQRAMEYAPETREK